jgi:hypothetical protein
MVGGCNASEDLREAPFVKAAMAAAAKAARMKVRMLDFMAVLLLGSGLDGPPALMSARWPGKRGKRIRKLFCGDLVVGWRSRK